MDTVYCRRYTVYRHSMQASKYFQVQLYNNRLREMTIIVIQYFSELY